MRQGINVLNQTCGVTTFMKSRGASSVSGGGLEAESHGVFVRHTQRVQVHRKRLPSESLILIQHLRYHPAGEMLKPTSMCVSLRATAAKSCSALSSHGRVHAAVANGAAAAPAPAHAPALVALDPKKRVAFKLVEKHELSHNVRRFRFALQSPQHKFGLPVGKHVFAYGRRAPCLRCW